MRRRYFSLFALATLPCTAAVSQMGEPISLVSADAQAVACSPQRPTTNRASAYDSTAIVVGGKRALICYGRPSARGRTMIGGTAVPYGKLWRTGANEPTTLHIPFAATIGGVCVQPGSYSIYTIPNEKEWHVIVNKSTSQWGHEGRYTAEVKAQEVGHGKGTVTKLKDHVETFTIKSVPAQNGANLLLEWEHTRVTIPIRPVAAK